MNTYDYLNSPDLTIGQKLSFLFFHFFFGIAPETAPPPLRFQCVGVPFVIIWAGIIILAALGIIQ